MLQPHDRVLPRRRDYIVPLIVLAVLGLCTTWGFVDIVRRLLAWTS